MRPREAAVMPLPSEEVTPPVTNTNLGTGWTSGVFLMIQRWRCSVQHGLNTRRNLSRAQGREPRALQDERLFERSGDGEGKAVQNDEPGSVARRVRWIRRNVDRLIT